MHDLTSFFPRYHSDNIQQGAPKEGLPILGPYANFPDSNGGEVRDRGEDANVPVGSLRFLRSQAAMESDMNTRKVVAGREMTGDSGVLSEVSVFAARLDTYTSLECCFCRCKLPSAALKLRPSLHSINCMN